MTSEVNVKEKSSLVTRFAERLGVQPEKMLSTLKATAFKQGNNMPEITNEQMMALMIVADQYKLNPFTKEIYAYPDKGGVVPVVSVDGWSRIINEHPAFDGVEFKYSEETVMHKGHPAHVWVECIIHRKDRSHATVIREYFDEVVRDANFKTPWDSHPKRMHRHKALIQGARVAFGFAGIYDQDEAERIIDVTPHDEPENKEPVKTVLPELTADQLKSRIADKTDEDGVVTFGVKSKIKDGKASAEDFISFLSAKFTLTDSIESEIKSWGEK
jgi:phage recombination protein Bet